MRESRFLVILIVISIFVIIGSIFYFLMSKKKVNEEVTEETEVVQDEKVSESEKNVSVDKQVQSYADENKNNVTDSNNVPVKTEVQNNSVNVQTENTKVAQFLQTPTLTKAPFSTNKNSESVEVNGEAGAEIFVNDWSVGFLDTNGKKTISLNTAGGDGDKIFSIFLRNQNSKSGVLDLVIKKITTSNSSNSTSNNSSNSSTKSIGKTWSYIYTNKEKFDINDYNVDELKLKDVCKENKGSYSYCYKTSNLGDKNNTKLGNEKCPSSCKIGQTCLLWNKQEKSSGSLYSWVAMYRCE